jgi:hypothetical protein
MASAARAIGNGDRGHSLIPGAPAPKNNNNIFFLPRDGDFMDIELVTTPPLDEKIPSA